MHQHRALERLDCNEEYRANRKACKNGGADLGSQAMWHGSRGSTWLPRRHNIALNRENQEEGADEFLGRSVAAPTSRA